MQVEETAISGERELQLISKARAHLIDGLILNPVLLASVTVQAWCARCRPPCSSARSTSTSVITSGSTTWRRPRSSRSHLVGLGHRRIAIVGSMRSETSRLRLKGYRAALRTAGMSRDPQLEIANPDWFPAGGAHAMTSY